MTAVDTILDDLRMPTLDIASRRAVLIFEAERAELLDPTHREDILQQYADPDICSVTQSALFTEMADQVRLYLEVKRHYSDSFISDDGHTKQEVLDRYMDRIEEIAAEMVPSPAVYVGTEAQARASIGAATTWTSQVSA